MGQTDWTLRGRRNRWIPPPPPHEYALCKCADRRTDRSQNLSPASNVFAEQTRLYDGKLRTILRMVAQKSSADCRLLQYYQGLLADLDYCRSGNLYSLGHTATASVTGGGHWKFEMASESINGDVCCWHGYEMRNAQLIRVYVKSL